jgi:hypothetical protein
LLACFAFRHTANCCTDILPAQHDLKFSFFEFCGLTRDKYPVSITPYDRGYDPTDIKHFLGWSKLTKAIYKGLRTDEQCMQMVDRAIEMLAPYRDMLDATDRKSAIMLFAQVPLLCLPRNVDWAGMFRHALDQRGHQVLFLFGERNTHVAIALFAVRTTDGRPVNVASVGRVLSGVFRWNEGFVNPFIPILKLFTGELWAIAAAHVASLRLSRKGGDDTGLFSKHSGDVGAIPAAVQQAGPDGKPVLVKHRGDVGAGVMSYQTTRLLLDPLAIWTFQRQTRESLKFNNVPKDMVKALGAKYANAGYHVDLELDTDDLWWAGTKYATGVSLLFMAKHHSLVEALVPMLDQLVRDRGGEVAMFSRADDVTESCSVHAAVIFPERIQADILDKDIRMMLKKELKLVTLLSMAPLDADDMPRNNPLALAILAGHYPTSCREREGLMDLLFNARHKQRSPPRSRAGSPMRMTTEPPPASRGPSVEPSRLREPSLRPRAGRSLSRPRVGRSHSRSRVEDVRVTSRPRLDRSPPRPSAVRERSLPRPRGVMEALPPSAPTDPRLAADALRRDIEAGRLDALEPPSSPLTRQIDEVARVLSPHQELRKLQLQEIVLHHPNWTKCGEWKLCKFFVKDGERKTHNLEFLNHKLRQLISFQGTMSRCADEIHKASLAYKAMVEQVKPEPLKDISHFLAEAHETCVALVPFVEPYASVGPLLVQDWQSEPGWQREAAAQAELVRQYQAQPPVAFEHVASIMLKVGEDNQLRRLHDCLCKANETIDNMAPNPTGKIFWAYIDWTGTAAKLSTLMTKLGAARILCAELAR